MDKERQIFKMVKDGFDSLTKSIGNIKIENPEIELNNDSLSSEIKHTNTILQKMLDEDMKEEKDEAIEITLKIE